MMCYTMMVSACVQSSAHGRSISQMVASFSRMLLPRIPRRTVHGTALAYDKVCSEILWRFFGGPDRGRVGSFRMALVAAGIGESLDLESADVALEITVVRRRLLLLFWLNNSWPA